MDSNFNTDDKQKIIHEEIAKWRIEYKKYRFWINVRLLLVFIPFVVFSIILFHFDSLSGYICSVFTCSYVLFVIVPALEEWGKISKCNLNNIHNIKIGIIRRKFYRQRKFSIFLAEIANSREIDIVKVTSSQFDKFRVGDKIIYFEYYPGAFAITYLPQELYDNNIEEIEKNVYTPTEKDIEEFVKFRRDITLYDNYLFFIVIIMVIITGIGIGIKTYSFLCFFIFTFIPLSIVLFVFELFVKPRYPFKVSEIENCLTATVLKKYKESKNNIRRYYYGKKYYYITVINSKGKITERIRVLPKTYDELKEGDKVICFNYRRPTLMFGDRAAVKDTN